MTSEELDTLYPDARVELAKPLHERDGSKLPPVGAFVSEVELGHASGNSPCPTR